MCKLTFRTVTLCGLAGRYLRLTGTYCLHLQIRIIMNMETVRSTETLVDTRRRHKLKDYNPEGESKYEDDSLLRYRTMKSCRR
jgi:hypothetical protein